MGFWTKRKTLGEGDPAPEFTLTALDGNPVSLSEALAAGPVLLAFFKNSCPVCKLTLPFLDRMHRAAPDKMRVYGVSQDSPAATRAFNAELGIAYPTLIDSPGYAVSNSYGITNVPTLFVVEQDGRISKKIDGFVRKDVQALADRAGTAVFREGDYVPEWRAG